MKIAVINTGGTISCIGDPLAPMTASDFARVCRVILDPIIKQRFPNIIIDYITDLIFPESKTGTLDSTNLQPTDWCRMAENILQNYEKYDGWVILHGTDSMDFTGAALPFLLSSFDIKGFSTAGLSKPVVITGSQVPMFYQAPTLAKKACEPSEHQSSNETLMLRCNTDAFQNYCGAIASAQSGTPEVCVFFQNKLYRGNRILKTNASEFDAFSSPNYPALGEYGIEFSIDMDNILPPPVSRDVSLDNLEVRKKVINQLDYIKSHINEYPVMQFNAFPAYYNCDSESNMSIIAHLIDACVNQGIKGLVLESYGEGNFPSGNPDNYEAGAIYKALMNARGKKVLVVDCTQVIAGIVNDSAYASGVWLPKVGALNPADMTSMAGFAKLMILMAQARFHSWTESDIKYLFQSNLLGEMIDVSRLDSRGKSALLPGQALTTLNGSATLINDPEKGPVLKIKEDHNGKETDKTVWKAFNENPPIDEMPGKLIMQNDGNLVFYTRYNSPIWATDTGRQKGASSVLLLNGTDRESLSLTVVNYSNKTVSKVLYPTS